MAFKFKFESILNLKSRLEEIKKGEFKKAAETLESEKGKLKVLVIQREEQCESMKLKEEEGFTATELISFTNYINTLKKKINTQKQNVKTAEEKLEKVRRELVKASQEKKMFEILKDKKKEEYLKEYYRKEQETLDEVVSFKYNSSTR